MDELSELSPASRERSLDDLPRKDLQQLAKEAGVKVTACFWYLQQACFSTAYRATCAGQHQE